MCIKFIAAVFACLLYHIAAFAAIEADDIARAHDRLAAYIAKGHIQHDGEAKACAMSVYQSALALLDENSGIISEMQREKNDRIRSYEQRIDTLNEEFEELLTSIKSFRQNLAVIGNAHFGVVMREEKGGIRFTPKLFIPKLPAPLSAHAVLNGENDRNWGEDRFADANKYNAFSLSEEEYARSGENRDLFFEVFKMSRAENINLSIINNKRRADQLSSELADLKVMKAEIMLQIEDEMAACIHARSAINLHQIGEIKIAFQIYGNALNSKSVKSLEAKAAIPGCFF